MKLKSFLAMMAVALVATGFTSCDNDDDENGGSNPSATLAGEFYGASGMTVMGSTSYDSTCVARVIAQANGKYSLVLPESTNKVTPEGKMPGMPSITMKDLELVETEKGIFTTEIAKWSEEVIAGKTANVTDLKLALNKAEKSIALTYNLQYGKMPLTIAYDFKTLFQNDFVVGEFLGASVSKVGAEAMPADNNLVVSISLQKDGKYTLVLPEAKKTKAGMALPKIEIANLDVTADKNVYTFAIDSTAVKTPQFNVILKDLKGKIYGNDITLEYNMKPGKMPFFVETKYEGNKLAKK